jgi:hypothetical protein
MLEAIDSLCNVVEEQNSLIRKLVELLMQEEIYREVLHDIEEELEKIYAKKKLIDYTL